MTSPDQFPEIPGLEGLASIGAGGMGSVFLARHHGAHGFERLVALKTIRAEIADRSIVRTQFLDEARLAARIIHPAVCQVHDFGERGNLLYLVMEYLPGCSIRNALRATDAPPGVACQIVAKVCRGLHAAHGLKNDRGQFLGVVHRDICPQNVFITFDGSVKVLDFGIALTRDRLTPQTMVGMVRGKLRYMAPEQLRGQPVDRRADIYSASLVLFRMVSGHEYYPIVNLPERLAADKKPRDLTSDDIPTQVVDLLRSGLANAPADRPVDARAFAEALEDVASSLGAESLERFAERALQEEREMNDAFLRQVLGQEVVQRTRGMTVPNGGEAAIAPTRTAPTVPVGAPLRTDPRGSRYWLGALAVLALMAALVWSWPIEPPPNVRAPERNSPPASGVPTEKGLENPLLASPSKAPLRAKQEKPLARHKKTVSAKPPEKPARRPTETAKATPPDAGPQKMGQITLGAEPYALIRIDGKNLGSTPLVDFELPAGTHRIQFVEPDTGNVRFAQTLEIKGGQSHKMTAPLR